MPKIRRRPDGRVELNQPPGDIPEPAANDLGLLAEIKAYNRAMADAEAHAGCIWATMQKRKGGGRHIHFGNGTRWATNDFIAADQGGRPDLVIGRSMANLLAPITDYDLGSE